MPSPWHVPPLRGPLSKIATRANLLSATFPDFENVTTEFVAGSNLGGCKNWKRYFSRFITISVRTVRHKCCEGSGLTFRRPELIIPGTYHRRGSASWMWHAIYLPKFPDSGVWWRVSLTFDAMVGTTKTAWHNNWSLARCTSSFRKTLNILKTHFSTQFI